MVLVTVVSPGGPEGGWGLTASLTLERMLQGEPEPDRGPWGGHSGRGSACSQCWETWQVFRGAAGTRRRAVFTGVSGWADES